MVGLLDNQFQHGTQYQESEQCHGQTAQCSHDDTMLLLKDDIVILIVEKQGISHTYEQYERQEPERVFGEKSHERRL